MSSLARRLPALRVLWPWLAGWLLVTTLLPYARADLRWVRFSGYDWWVKSSAGLAGPGPNYFSDSTNNVWVDAQGQLHLKITYRSGQWQCAEVVSNRSFGYGSYRFALASSVGYLDANAVLGLFTWSDNAADAHREIDVECSRWGNASDSNNAQFVVQPYDATGHLVRFAVPPSQTNATHCFTWETNRLTFQSQRGSYAPNPDPGAVLRSWTYTLGAPPSGDENVRLNLWLFRGAAPAGNQEVEVILPSFQFVPLGPPRPAVLTNFSRLPGGQVQFEILGQKDRRYQVQAATDQAGWQPLASLLATNAWVPFLDASLTASRQRFFRALTLP